MNILSQNLKDKLGAWFNKHAHSIQSALEGLVLAAFIILVFTALVATTKYEKTLKLLPRTTTIQPDTQYYLDWNEEDNTVIYSQEKIK